MSLYKFYTNGTNSRCFGVLFYVCVRAAGDLNFSCVRCDCCFKTLALIIPVTTLMASHRGHVMVRKINEFIDAIREKATISHDAKK